MNRAELRRQILTCTRCPLHALANGPVPFRGPQYPELLVIGEAPGRWEDRAKKPFVGPSGSLLGRYLSQAGFDVTDRVSFANTVCCWPNRAKQSPSWHEIDACVRNLDDQITYFAPGLILLCGMTATTPFWPNLTMKQVHGRWWTIKGTPTLATYHPAAVLRDPSLGPILMEDLEIVRIGPALTSGHRNYQCVMCEADAEVWVSEGRDVTNSMGGLGIGWCIRHLRNYRRKYRGAGGGAVQLSLLVEAG
jgi:uracil-DNA glycosylase family 4